MQVNMHEAKSQLSALAEKAHRGEEIIIAKAGKPYLRLLPFETPTEPRVPGILAGKIIIADDFNDEAASNLLLNSQ